MRLVRDDLWAVLTIWAEARGEPFAGKVAVAEVIRNRTARKYSSDGTVAGTVLRAAQFSCWSTNDPNRILAAKLDDDDPVVRDCRMAWEEATGGANSTGGAVLYYNPGIVHPPPRWAETDKHTVTIGGHAFYRD